MGKNENANASADAPSETDAADTGNPESGFIDHEARALHVTLAKLIDKQRGGLMPQLNKLARDYTDAVRELCPPDETDDETEEKANG